MKLNAFIILLFISMSVGLLSCGNPESKQAVHEHKKNEAHHHVFQCPMDCEKGKTYEKPGKCPVCKMDLKETHEHTEGDGHNH